MPKLQSTIEFLTSYGWAILAVAVVLIALIYLGVFNINSGNICVASYNYLCSDVATNGSAIFIQEFSQNFPYTWYNITFFLTPSQNVTYSTNVSGYPHFQLYALPSSKKISLLLSHINATEADTFFSKNQLHITAYLWAAYEVGVPSISSNSDCCLTQNGKIASSCVIEEIGRVQYNPKSNLKALPSNIITNSSLCAPRKSVKTNSTINNSTSSNSSKNTSIILKYYYNYVEVLGCYPFVYFFIQQCDIYPGYFGTYGFDATLYMQGNQKSYICAASYSNPLEDINFLNGGVSPFSGGSYDQVVAVGQCSNPETVYALESLPTLFGINALFLGGVATNQSYISEESASFGYGTTSWSFTVPSGSHNTVIVGACASPCSSVGYPAGCTQLFNVYDQYYESGIFAAECKLNPGVYKITFPSGAYRSIGAYFYP
ncbi:MAG: hypothetical protein ARM1_0107 [Candidatus Micrarchaeota archaeon]|nr:MAG: hypothetical protein ARM1_0107 [Candidatus Micrarchaeota archaeon]